MELIKTTLRFQSDQGALVGHNSERRRSSRHVRGGASLKMIGWAGRGTGNDCRVAPPRNALNDDGLGLLKGTSARQ
jgi:hypothetical protein